MTTWLVLAAIVQAAAAIVIALFTVMLVRFTRDYVGEMRRLNNLQQEANLISRQTLEQATAFTRPFLRAQGAGYSGTVGGEGSAQILVENRGGGVAVAIRVQTTQGEFNVPGSIEPNLSEVIEIPAPRDWTREDKVVVESFTFRDFAGRDWHQPIGDVPRLAE